MLIKQLIITTIIIVLIITTVCNIRVFAGTANKHQKGGAKKTKTNRYRYEPVKPANNMPKKIDENDSRTIFTYDHLAGTFAFSGYNLKAKDGRAMEIKYNGKGQIFTIHFIDQDKNTINFDLYYNGMVLSEVLCVKNKNLIIDSKAVYETYIESITNFKDLLDANGLTLSSDLIPKDKGNDAITIPQ